MHFKAGGLLALGDVLFAGRNSQVLSGPGCVRTQDFPPSASGGSQTLTLRGHTTLGSLEHAVLLLGDWDAGRIHQSPPVSRKQRQSNLFLTATQHSLPSGGFRGNRRQQRKRTNG